MDHAEDVERLFSWLKAPMVHYREFAPHAEVAEAVAAWPALHKTAVETGLAGEEQPAPHGDGAARERIARERKGMPDSAARAIRASPLSGPPPAPTLVPDRPIADELVTALGERLREERAETAEPQPQSNAAAPMHSFDEPVQPALRSAVQPAGASAPHPAGTPAARRRGALFGGEYRGRERGMRSNPQVADRQDRSLDAVFSRLSGGRDRLPDPRERARTSPGLGIVFGRLR